MVRKLVIVVITLKVQAQSTLLLIKIYFNHKSICFKKKNIQKTEIKNNYILSFVFLRILPLLPWTSEVI